MLLPGSARTCSVDTAPLQRHYHVIADWRFGRTAGRALLSRVENLTASLFQPTSDAGTYWLPARADLRAAPSAPVEDIGTSQYLMNRGREHLGDDLMNLAVDRARLRGSVSIRQSKQLVDAVGPDSVSGIGRSVVEKHLVRHCLAIPSGAGSDASDRALALTLLDCRDLNRHLDADVEAEVLLNSLGFQGAHHLITGDDGADG